MGSRILILFGSLAVVVACDSPGPVAPPASLPPPVGRPTGNPGPSGPASNPPIALDIPVEGTVDATYPDCFPNWDATGHCRQYNFVAASDGVIVASLTWSGPSSGLYEPDVFLVAPDGAWEYTKDTGHAKQVSIRVRAGLTYRVVVLSYGETEVSFGLLVRLQ